MTVQASMAWQPELGDTELYLAGLTTLLQVGDAQRQSFNQKRLVRAVNLLGQQGQWSEQSLFIRALSENLDNDADRLTFDYVRGHFG